MYIKESTILYLKGLKKCINKQYFYITKQIINKAKNNLCLNTKNKIYLFMYIINNVHYLSRF